jgi:hypothetical protein
VMVVVVVMCMDRPNDDRRSAAVIGGRPRSITVARHIGVVWGVVWRHRLGTSFDAGRQDDRCEESKSAHTGDMVRRPRGGKTDPGGRLHRNEK